MLYFIQYQYGMILGLQGNRASYYELEKLHDHDLGIQGKHFTAFNMACGSFGGSRNRDLIIVQSMDGKLQIFENAAVAFTGQLSDCLLPGPMTYLPRIDAFVIASYACRLECIRYQVMLSSLQDDPYESKQDAKVQPSESQVTSVRSAMVEWTVNLGENCRQIQKGCFLSRNDRNTVDDMLVLTDRSVFLLKENGVVLQQLRLEKDPNCIQGYRLSRGSNKIQLSNFLIAYNDGTIQIYHEMSLIWATMIGQPAVQMQVASFGDQDGFMVTVSDTGLLTIGYLGTKPPANAVVTQARALDYDKIDEEHKVLYYLRSFDMFDLSLDATSSHKRFAK